MDEAAVPAGLTGRHVLVQGLESAENRAALGTGSAARSARPRAPSAETSGSPFAAASKPWT
eukprot:15286496-Alexandrium_andersonii.AAC.1